MANFIDVINGGATVILDGGMGTLMQQLGGSLKSGENNLLHPQIVERAHRLYAEAGSDAITSNTFSLNAAYAAKQGEDKQKTEDALAAALEIAATVCDGKLFLLGDIGPSGEMLAPLGKGDPEQLYEAFCRQAELMAAYPLDAFLIETVFDLKEAQIILRACLDIAPQIPVLLSLTFSSLKKGGCTMMGNSAAQIAAAAAQQGAAAVGANCGDLTPADYAQVIASMRAACELPLLIQPNAGKPQRQGGEIIYSLAAAEFAQEMASCYAAGARLLGGCCGTTPEHIAALAARYKG
ncbi:MAG: homocysteine S-methyltransferase family protein [Clostridia bacterium]|nr:homocysteine S-methyltransferase family protein [Clostridia bacterium]